jgi:hypothetical protein
MSDLPTSSVEAPRWDDSRLNADRLAAIDDYRRVRMEAPLQQYLRWSADSEQVFQTLLRITDDLRDLDTSALQVVADPKLLEAFRHLTGPPISLADLKLLVNARNFSVRALKADPELVRRVIATIYEGLDRMRFPWLSENRSPTGSERRAALIASAAVLASTRVTRERLVEGDSQEADEVEGALLEEGFRRAGAMTVLAMSEAPRRGEYSREAVFLGRRADFLIHLWDDRLMPVECTVSTSQAHSTKRLLEAAVKASVWTHELGKSRVIPSAVLSGVYQLRELRSAQDRGLTLFWSHNLDVLRQWISRRRL